MWISKDKYDALVKRIEKLEAAVNEGLTVSLPTGKTEMKYVDWLGMQDMPIMAKFSVKEAIRQIVSGAGLCIEYEPEKAAVPARSEIKKCDKKGK